MADSETLTLDPSAPRRRTVVQVPPEDERPAERSWFLRERPAFKGPKLGME